MTNAAKSIVAFGVYALLAGGALLFKTNLTLQFLGFEKTSEHWILLVALVMMGLGFYYVVLGVTDVKIFFLPSVIGRVIFFSATVLLIATSKVPVGMLLFGAVDLISATWTSLAMYVDKKQTRLTT